MDPKLTVALGDAALSAAEELFADESKWRDSRKEAARIVGFLQPAIASYEEVLSDETLEEGLKGKAKANLQKAQDMLHALGAFKEYIDGETIPLDEILKELRDKED